MENEWLSFKTIVQKHESAHCLALSVPNETEYEAAGEMKAQISTSGNEYFKDAYA